MKNLFRLLILSFFFISCNKTPERTAEESKYIAEVNNRRLQLDEYFRTHERSPLDSTQKAAFKGLNYYPVDPAFRVKGVYKSIIDELPFEMPYSLGGSFEFVKAGEIHFSIGDTACMLNVYRDLDQAATPGYAGQLIIPFYDQTNKYETYPAGRFLEFFTPDPSAGSVTLDFNLAYNPFCVYNHTYNCPIPPPENLLKVSIKAGEKMYGQY
jgi:uncharacterized protein (DUF1684 family)